RVACAAADACRGEPRVLVAYLHGSAARGEPAADVDIGVYVEEPAAARDVFAICERIATAVERGACPGLPLDVRPLNRAGPPLRFAALSEGRLLYERSAEERVVIEAEWMSEWHDFLPFWRRQVARALGEAGP
ncbi:MAG: nucleotidyltransferase domain-containing protein, partial [Deltaproteobacteria bacterium]|nr:nucleotidyltransferase domain-containing protein [Deltaproteobacteria bacterium]